jgi:2'-5' RNA ligase
MRTFVAVEIGDNKILNSIREVQSKIRISARAVDAQNMHFTLLFLGEITEEMAGRVSDQLKTITFSPFDISFEGVGAFPKPKFPRVVWVGVKGGADELVNLAKVVEEKLGPLGFKADKPFKPHVTIFRVRDRGGDITDQISKYADTKFGAVRVSEIKFKKSVLTPQGPIYSDLEVIRAS